MSWYAVFKFLTGLFVRSISRIEVSGRENIPSRGPFLLVPNHQSVLDPFYVQGSVARNDLHALTKSTQFRGRFFRWILPRLHSFPVRRFQVDPQAVRTILRLLEDGQGVCIYVEGERSWDGAIQPLRRGAIRVILKAGVPVIPCGVSGSFDVWPRWSRRIRRHTVRIRFGEPMEFGRHDDRAAREAKLDETHARIRRALAELSGEPLASEPGAQEPAHRGASPTPSRG